MSSAIESLYDGIRMFVTGGTAKTRWFGVDVVLLEAPSASLLLLRMRASSSLAAESVLLETSSSAVDVVLWMATVLLTGGLVRTLPTVDCSRWLNAVVSGGVDSVDGT
jgi:hypothetical protein